MMDDDSIIDFQALWIEIIKSKGSNVIVGVIYRNPNGDCTSFLEYIERTLAKINRQNNVCSWETLTLTYSDMKHMKTPINSWNLLWKISFFTTFLKQLDLETMVKYSN